MSDTVRCLPRRRASDPRGGLVSNIGGWQSRKAINFLEEGARQAGAGGVAVQRLHLRIVRRTTISPPVGVLAAFADLVLSNVLRIIESSALSQQR